MSVSPALKLAFFALAVSSLGSLPLGSAQAATVLVQGASGSNGADGVGGPGTDGAPGGAATAITLPNSDASNSATATGGAGGSGGAVIWDLLGATEAVAARPVRSRSPPPPMSLGPAMPQLIAMAVREVLVVLEARLETAVQEAMLTPMP
jgi:hypothetical protein